MSENRNITPIRKISFVFIFVFIVVAVISILKLIPFSEIFKKPGVITYDQSVEESEKQFIDNLVKDVKLNHDATISAKTLDNTTEDIKNSILVDVEVPVVDFYSSKLDITSKELSNLKSSTSFNLYNASSIENTTSSDLKLIPYYDLNSSKRLVSVDNNYYLDDSTKGARKRYIIIDSEDSSEIIDLIKSKAVADIATQPTKDNTLSFAQTGVTALSRQNLTTLNGRAGGNGGYFAEQVKDFLAKNDYTHISNEVSFADDCRMTSDSMKLCSDWRMLDSITDIGTDIVELTGNHNNNFGHDSYRKTVRKYQELGIATVGGGINAEEAAKPLELDKKDTKITFLAYNRSTSSVGNGELATSDTPGANAYSNEQAQADISEAKQKGNFVIVDIQFFECWCYPASGEYEEVPECDYPINGQQGLFRSLVDMGADIVVGTQAHQPQTFEQYNGSTIYYGLGNLFFDQVYWPGTERSLILTHYFVNGKYVQTRVTPTVYDEDHKPKIMETKDAEGFISRLINASSKGV